MSLCAASLTTTSARKQLQINMLATAGTSLCHLCTTYLADVQTSFSGKNDKLLYRVYVVRPCMGCSAAAVCPVWLFCILLAATLIPTTALQDLERKFGKYGKVRDARIVRNPRTGESRGFGFVVMDHDDDVDRVRPPGHPRLALCRSCSAEPAVEMGAGQPHRERPSGAAAAVLER